MAATIRPVSFPTITWLLMLLLMLPLLARQSDASQDDQLVDRGYHHQVQLDRHMAVACTNRHNCERTCQRALVAKQSSKVALVDALTRTIGESTLTDAHKLGIQLGRHKSCDRCALIYSNCGDQWYSIARRRFSTWRFESDGIPAMDDGPNRL